MVYLEVVDASRNAPAAERTIGGVPSLFQRHIFGHFQCIVNHYCPV